MRGANPLLPILLLALLALPRPATAKEKPSDDPDDPGEEEDEGDDHGEEEGEHGDDGDDGGHAGGAHHHRFLVGAKGGGVWLKSAHHEAGLAGGGVFAEVSVVHGWLEIELGAKLLTAKDEGVHVPIDLLIKKPFSVPNATLYLGIGPALDIVSHHDETHAYFGIAGAIGVYLWVKDPFGIVLELNEALVFKEEVTNALGGSAGVVFGF